MSGTIPNISSSSEDDDVQNGYTESEHETPQRSVYKHEEWFLTLKILFVDLFVSVSIYFCANINCDQAIFAIIR